MSYKDNLQYGDQTAIAKALGYSPKYISHMVNGRKNMNPKVANMINKISYKRTIGL
ncbi:MAG: hypothetical protein JEY96_00810 [Bacteroidales bacterium]|nr:hypothetical protein [Bacteroidales bacterium]